MSKYKTYGAGETPQLTELILIEDYDGVFSVDEHETFEDSCKGCHFENDSWAVCYTLPNCYKCIFHLTKHDPNE